MSSQQPEDPTLFEKLRELPPEKLAEVEDFVDSLRLQGREPGALAGCHEALGGRIREGME